MSTSASAVSPANRLPSPRILIRGAIFVPAATSAAPASDPNGSETIRVVGEELIDIILGHDDAGDLDRLRLPGLSSLDRIEDRLESRFSLLVSGLPHGCGQVAVLDELQGLRAAVDRHGRYIGSAGLAKSGDGALRRFVPASPDGEGLLAACGVSR